ncbi:MAG: DUF11 domain-containing protein, partial [Verrucomicrobia bacterium]|nr:DUF11 domain-containing protein [Verrucomicrobiota bacterium]
MKHVGRRDGNRRDQTWARLVFGFAVAALVGLAVVPRGKAALAVAPPFNADYTVHALGSVPGVPERYGGVTFKYDDPQTLLIGGDANALPGAIYAIKVARDVKGHVTNFVGEATFFAPAPRIDGGVAYGPGDVLFLAQWPDNRIGQVKPGSTLTDKVIDLSPRGVLPSPGGLNFVPRGFPGAGLLKMVCWREGQFYSVELKPASDGTYDFVADPVLETMLTGEPEGFIYVPPGSPQFTDFKTMLVSEFTGGEIAAYQIDANGAPLLNTRRSFVKGVFGAQGAAIDPQTGDFLFSIHGGSNYVVSVRGFVSPAVVTVNNVGVREGDTGKTNAVFTVSLSPPSSRTVKVGFFTVEGNATPGADYDNQSGTLTFLPGVVGQTVLVPVIGDRLRELDETFSLFLTNVINASLNTNRAVGTIFDDEGPPSLVVANVAVAEGDTGTTDLVFTVELSLPTTEAVTVNYATSDGTATAGSDYDTRSGSLAFPPNTTSRTVTVPVRGDTVFELDETFFLTLSDAVNATRPADPAAGTIRNDDPRPRLSVANVEVAEGNAGPTNAVFTLQLSGVSSQEVAVNFVTSDGTATAGVDYAATNGAVHFPPGITTTNLTVVVNGDLVFEAAETLFVDFASAVNADLDTSRATGTILNDDPFPVISITNPSVAEGNAGTTDLIFTLSLNVPSSQPITVNYTTTAGTALAGEDFVPTNGTVRFIPGTTSTNLTVQVKGDLVFESNETLFVDLSGQANANLAAARATGTILNDDPQPTISIAGVAAPEGDSGQSDAICVVTLSGPSSEEITVKYATIDGSAKAGEDYVATAGTLTFAPGVTAKNVPVPIKGDVIYEADEVCYVLLTDPTRATLGPDLAEVTIRNDDPLPGLSIDDVSLFEGHTGTTSATFTVRLSGPSSQTISVDYATLDGTANAGTDYASASSTLFFAAGNTAQTITVRISGDTLYEPDETFTVNLTGAKNADLTDGQGVGTIRNDEALPKILIADAATQEGDAGTKDLPFTVSLTGPSSLAIAVDVAAAPDSATVPADFTFAAQTVTLPPGSTSQTVVAAIVGDQTEEPDETFTLNLSNAANATIQDGQALGTILNDDRAIPAASIADVSVVEGNTGTTTAEFVVTLSGPSSQLITIGFATSEGTAKAAEDYVHVASSLNIAAGQTSGTVRVTVNGDLAEEPNETFFVTLTSAVNATIGGGGGLAVGTIVNDDAPATEIDHFEWAPVPSPQYVGQPFPVTITAKDLHDVTVTSFTGTANLRGLRGIPVKPVKVLTFTKYTHLNNEYPRMLGAISAGFRNYVETSTTATSPAVLEAQLAGQDVFLVAEQADAPPGEMARLGSAWAEVLERFVSKGGTVVVCSHDRDEHLVLSTGGLLALTKGTVYEDLTPVELSKPGESVYTVGVPASFTGLNVSTYTTANGEVALQAVNDGKAVVISRAIAKGNVVMIGTDFFTTGTPLDRILANAVKHAEERTLTEVRITPVVTGNFVSGVWTGDLTVQEIADSMYLLAEDDEGHSGAANYFTARLANDLAVAINDAPDPVSLGGTLTYTLTLTNTGPAAATAVVLTDPLPAGVRFESATLSQGSHTVAGNTVTCNVGTLAAGAEATITLVVTVTQSGTVTNRVTVTRGEPDAEPANNSGTAITAVSSPPAISIFDQTFEEKDTGTLNRALIVGLSAPSTETVTVDFVTVEGTASAGADFQPANSQLIFPPGQTTQPLYVGIQGDILDEDNETFRVELRNPRGAVLAFDKAEVTIRDDDRLPALSVSNEGVAEPATGATNVVFRLSLSAASGRPVSVNFATADAEATAPGDYTPTSGVLTFAPGVTSQTVTVIVHSDAIGEVNETYYLNLTNEKNVLLLSPRGVGTIRDSGVLPDITIRDVSLPEGHAGTTPAVFVVQLSVPIDQPITVDFTTADGTAVAGSDFVAAAGRLTFPPGITRTNLTLHFTGDRLVEGDEKFYVNLSNASSNARITNSQAIGTIRNDDTVEAIVDLALTVAAVPNPVTVGSNLTYQLVIENLGPDDASGVWLSNRFSATPPLFLSSTGGQGNCTTNAAGAVLCEVGGLAAGASATFTLVVAPAQVGSLTNRATVTATENDPALANNSATVVTAVTPPPAIVVNNLLITEGNSGYARAVFSVGLIAPSAQTVTVDYATTDDLAKARADYEAISGTLTFDPGDTNRLVTVLVKGDTLDEDNETFFLSLANEIGAPLQIPRGIGTILDDDKVPLLSITNVTVLEGNTGTTDAVFDVRLSAPSGRNVSVNFATANGTALAPIDYSGRTGQLVFAPGVTNLQVKVPVVGDQFLEADELFYVDLSNEVNALLVVSRGVGTILNDDIEGGGGG